VSRRRPRVRGLEKLAFSIFIGVAHTKKETANLKKRKRGTNVGSLLDSTHLSNFIAFAIIFYSKATTYAS